MRRIRTGLILGVTALALAGPLRAQVGPTLTGESGLFELQNGDSLPAGRFSLGLFYSQGDRTAAPSVTFPSGVDDPLRYGVGKLGITVGYGMSSAWEVSLSTGERFYYADNRLWSGVINGFDRTGRIRHSETDKVRIGTKFVFGGTKPADPSYSAPSDVKLALFGGISIPTQSKNDFGALSTNRADYDFGLSMNYWLATVQVSYLLAGDRGIPSPSPSTPEIGFDIPNQLAFGLGFGVPIIPDVLKGIAEVDRVHYDGGDTKPPDFTEALVGARVAIGKTGLTAGGAVRVNIDRWIKYGNRPNNIGGLVQIAYSPPPLITERPRVVATRETPPEAPPAAPPAPEPAPAEPSAAPPPRAATSTTDEILFDAGRSRLTNIAKAILDGVALRLKNNLSATCTIVSTTDPKEKGGDHKALSLARAEAAKDYLVKRHGIDAARIQVEGRGDGDAADATRNRRGVVTVTFP